MEKLVSTQKIQRECIRKSYQKPQLTEIGSILKETQTNATGSTPDNPAVGTTRYSQQKVKDSIENIVENSDIFQKKVEVGKVQLGFNISVSQLLKPNIQNDWSHINK